MVGRGTVTFAACRVPFQRCRNHPPGLTSQRAHEKLMVPSTSKYPPVDVLRFPNHPPRLTSQRARMKLMVPSTSKYPSVDALRCPNHPPRLTSRWARMKLVVPSTSKYPSVDVLVVHQSSEYAGHICILLLSDLNNPCENYFASIRKKMSRGIHVLSAGDSKTLLSLFSDLYS